MAASGRRTGGGKRSGCGERAAHRRRQEERVVFASREAGEGARNEAVKKFFTPQSHLVKGASRRFLLDRATTRPRQFIFFCLFNTCLET